MTVLGYKLRLDEFYPLVAVFCHSSLFPSYTRKKGITQIRNDDESKLH